MANSIAAITGAGQVECDQRPWRAGQECLAGRDCHGASCTEELFEVGTGYNRGNLQSQSPRQRGHRYCGAAEQSDRWSQCVCPRVRHPSGRNFEGQAHLRNYDPQTIGLTEHKLVWANIRPARVPEKTREMGHQLGELDKAFDRFKHLADRRGSVRRRPRARSLQKVYRIRDL